LITEACNSYTEYINDNTSMQLNLENEGNDNEMANKAIILQLLKLLANVGGQLYQIGESKLSEQCYTYYIAIFEIIFGDNTFEIAQCYFWISQYYFESFQYDKAKISLQKSLLILKQLQPQNQNQILEAEVHFNLGILFKK
jgi:hypothetical protein